MVHTESLSESNYSLPNNNALFVAADAAYILELSHSYTLRLTFHGPCTYLGRTTCCYGNGYQWQLSLWRYLLPTDITA